MSAACSNDSRSIYSSDSDRPVLTVASRRDVIEGLRARIRRIEVGGDFTAPASVVPARAALRSECWASGVPALDALLGPQGFDAGGVHEIRSAALADGTTAASSVAARRSFALLLAARRCAALERPRPILWCLSAAAAHETGFPYSRGLAALGLDPGRVVIVAPRKTQDVLWVAEEAVKADCLSLVLAELTTVGASAARRLSLAAAEKKTPCLLVSGPGRGVAAATRWRVAPRPSGENALDPGAPGARAFDIVLERCRARPLVSGEVEFAVEWSDAARCFSMATAVSGRAPATGGAIAEAGGAARIARRIG